MLDELIAPVDKTLGRCLDILTNRGNGRVEIRCIAGELPFCGNRRIEVVQKTNPDTRLDTLCAHFVSKRLHVAETRIAVIPRTCSRVVVPAVVNDHVRAVFKTFAKLCDVFGVGQHFLAGGLAVRIVPVVGAVDGFFREDRVGTHVTAELVTCGERIGIRIFTADDGRSIQDSAIELDTHTAAANVKVQRNAVAVSMPDAHCAGSDTDTVACKHLCLCIIRKEIPRHMKLGRDGTPVQGAVTALPVVAVNRCRVGQGTSKAQKYPGYSRCFGGQRNIECITVGCDADGNIARGVFAVSVRGQCGKRFFIADDRGNGQRCG